MILNSSQLQAVISFNNEIAKGKSKTEAAEIVGISRSTIGGWLAADNAPKVKPTKAVAKKEPAKQVSKKAAKPAAKEVKPKKVPEPKRTPVVQPAQAINKEIFDRIVKVIAIQMDVPEEDINLTSSFMDDLGGDSLDAVELVMALEDEFEIEITDEDAENMKTVQHAYDYIVKAIGVDEDIAVEFIEDEKEENEDKLVPFQAIILPGTLMVVRDGSPVQIDKSHKNFEKINQIVKNTVKGQIYSKDLQALYDLIDIKAALTKWSHGRIAVSNAGGVQVDGNPLHGKLADVLMRCLEEADEAGLTKFAKFHDKVSQAMSNKVTVRLFEFVSKNSLKIDENGDVLAFKIVRSTYMDKHSNTMDNSVGKTVEMPRNQVNDDDDATCSHGLHCCSATYFSTFYGNGDRMVQVKVDPRDFCSIPRDYNGSKARVCKYVVTKDITDDFIAGKFKD